MIIVDTALAERAEASQPILFGMFGAGFMGRGILNQADTLKGSDAPRYATGPSRRRSTPSRQQEWRISRWSTAPPSSTRSPDVVAPPLPTTPRSWSTPSSLECLLEATGHVEYGALTIDGFGGYMTYGLCENHDITRREGLLPIGLAEGSVPRRDVAKDELVYVDDVDYPEDTLIHRLRKEQDALFDSEGVSA